MPRTALPSPVVIALVAMVTLLPVRASAQAGTGSATGAVSLGAVRTDNLSVTIVSGGTQTLPVLTDNALNTFPGTVRIRTRWNLQPFVTNGVSLVAYFTTPSQALVNGTDAIPSSRMLGRLNATPYQPFTQGPSGGVGTAGGSLQLFFVDFGFLNLFNTNVDRTDDLQLQIDLRGAPATLAGTYSGVLTLRAVSL